MNEERLDEKKLIYRFGSHPGGYRRAYCTCSDNFWYATTAVSWNNYQEQDRIKIRIAVRTGYRSGKVSGQDQDQDSC